ncbi:tyrosine-type recombinase/integrase [Clostridium estertheticum]|uniref:tyrosine-type recombinase/integrase n=1 Tax=Clostridium estertheticum TaxID=238834 RepID=UPI00209AD928|nr:tyrosine-type recombinase/integrase [Clostridium estertheticum]WAG64519.1 tyrosine-type recombinase/integrase [Clostridium estertheticum]
MQSCLNHTAICYAYGQIRRYCVIILKNHFRSGERYIPYIYTDNELKRFFNETDKCYYCSECPHRHLILPIIFRMIYSCGLRVSEARLLKVEDVDLNSGILTINHSKKDNSRWF